jgi:hypothetical protein
MNPIPAYQAYSWVSTMAGLLTQAIDDHQAAGVVLHYAASMLLWQIPAPLHIPVFVVYHAPGLVSKTVPWVFDKLLKDPAFQLYDKDPGTGLAYKQACMDSWFAYYTKLNMNIATTVTAKDIRQRLGGKVHHLFCWDKAVTRTIEPAFKASLKVHQPGTLYTSRYAAKAWYSPETKSRAVASAPAALLKWLKDAPTLLVSFGSYSASRALEVAQPLMLRVLDEFGIRVLYHATTAEAAAAVENTAHRRVHQGWLPYEWAVPRCAAVLFTGSVCLQSVCAYNATPMIFCPLLAEQFFWARNYQAMTGTPYVSYMSQEADIVTALLRAWFEKDGGRTQAYLTRCAKGIKRHDGSKGVAKIIGSVVAGRH